MMLYLTDYNEAERAALQDSFKTQFRDLRLKDFSDAFGVLRFKSLLPSPMMIQNPYIFKMTKDDASFLTIGTCHTVPLSVYPQNLINLLLSNKHLYIEAGIDNEEEGDQDQVDETDENLPSIECAEQDWFEDLPVNSQQVLDSIFQEDVPHYKAVSLHVLAIWFDRISQ